MDKRYLPNDICVCCGAPVPEGWQVCRDCDQRVLLAGKLNRLTPKDADLHDWNDALEYLTRATAEQGKAALIAGLSAP